MDKFKSYLLSSLTLLLIIFLLGTFLRFHNLANNPPSLNWDEVAFAYNAHSLIETGRDEYGRSFPLYFQSLDDYKLPTYMYLSVASEKLYGYNNFAVRFPAALFGSLTIILVFFLSQLWLKNKYVSLLAALLFAVLPWHIQFSRMAAEATVGLFFFLTGLLCFFWSLGKRSWLLPLSFLCFAISQYTYLTFRFIIPLMGVILLLLYRKQIFKKNIFVYITCVLVIIFSLLLLYDSYLHRNTSRTVGIAAVTPNTPQYKQDTVELVEDGKHGINLPRRLFHDSHIFSSIDIVARNYLSHFSPDFLFFNLQQTRHYTPGFGLLYLWMIPFIMWGLFLLSKVSYKTAIVIASLVLLPPLPAAFAFDSPNAIRTIALTLPFSMLVALSLVTIGQKLFHLRMIYFCAYVLILAGIIFPSTYHFYHQNMLHLPQERSSDWQYGRKEMTEYILKHQNEYDTIVASTLLEWPNIFFLYYSDYDPKKYLANGGTISGDWNSQRNKIENMEFHTFTFPYETNGKRVLFIGKPIEFPAKVKPIHVIHYLDGTPAIYIVDEKQATISAKVL